MQQVSLLSVFIPPKPAFLSASALLEVTHCLITAASAAEGVREWLRADGVGGLHGRLTQRHVIIVVRRRRGGTLTHVTDSQRGPTYEADMLRIIYLLTQSACRVVDLLCLVWTRVPWQGEGGGAIMQWG